MSMTRKENVTLAHTTHCYLLTGHLEQSNSFNWMRDMSNDYEQWLFASSLIAGTWLLFLAPDHRLWLWIITIASPKEKLISEKWSDHDGKVARREWDSKPRQLTTHYFMLPVARIDDVKAIRAVVAFFSHSSLFYLIIG